MRARSVFVWVLIEIKINTGFIGLEDQISEGSPCAEARRYVSMARRAFGPREGNREGYGEQKVENDQFEGIESYLDYDMMVKLYYHRRKFGS